MIVSELDPLNLIDYIMTCNPNGMERQELGLGLTLSRRGKLGELRHMQARIQPKPEMGRKYEARTRHLVNHATSN